MVLQVDRPGVRAAVASGDLAKQVEGWALPLFIVHNMCQEQAFLGGVRQHVPAQCLKQFDFTVNHP